MTTTIRKHFKPCVPGAFDGGLSRTAFFDGMVLTEGDMVREQSYWRGKRRLTNRALGQGIVWGLSVHWDHRSRKFCISPGYGLGCCGDDLVVAHAQLVAESELVDRCSEDFRRLPEVPPGEIPSEPGAETVTEVQVKEPRREACLLLEYVECAEDARPAFEDGCASTGEEGCRYGAVRETTRLRLVPPPPPPGPGAIGAFLEQVEALRGSIEGQEGIEPLLFGTEPAAWISIAFLDNAGLTLTAAGTSLPLEQGASAPVDVMRPTSGAASMRLGLEPPPGYVFTRLELAGTVREAAEALGGAFYPTMAMPTSQTDVLAKVHIAPLFGTAPGWSAEIRLRVPVATTGNPTLTGTVEKLEQLPTRIDCASLLAGCIALAGDAGSTGRALALAGLCGWFTGQLGNAGSRKEGDPDLSPDEQARVLLAWTVCRLAWRGLFGLDPALAPQAGLENCLRELFKAWCDGLHYKGPRCDGSPHGVVLGTLQLSSKGKILAFDEWKHRRHVLTGPLLSQWAAQAGVAPLDQAVARLARWVCCVAGARLPEYPGTPDPADEILLKFAGGALSAGREYGAEDHVAGAEIHNVRPVGGFGFIQRLLSLVMEGSGSLYSATALNVYSAGNGKLNLFDPIGGSGPQQVMGAMYAPARSEAMLEEIGMRGAAVPPTARRALRDFVTAYAESLPLKMLKAPAQAPAFEPLVEALDAGGIASVADLVDAGPEQALERARPRLAGHATLADARSAEKAMALVYDSAVKVLAGAGQAVAEKARAADEADPFTRSELAEAGTVSAVRKAVAPLLRERAQSSTDVRNIAARVVAMRG